MTPTRLSRPLLTFALLLLAVRPAAAQGQPPSPAKFIRENYTRATHKIAMRDGTHLYTIVYQPKDATEAYPILLLRTPYGIGPYAEDEFRQGLGPNKHFAFEKYIFAYQDVRGRFMSEGTYENMRPQLDRPGGPKDIDESTDTYDTIDWLVKNVPNNNGKVGQYGISYPGFYTSAGMVNAHPALKASSPQAPIADWFFDDWFHHGAFFLAHAFPFLANFGQARPEPTTKRPPGFNFGTPDGYQFFLDIGSLRNVNPKWYKGKIAYWDTIAEHPNYDAFWQARNLLPHLRKVAPAVMTVGGWYDAEDLYGTFQTYRAVEKQNPGIFNVIVVGPWAHGGWAGQDGSKLGDAYFGSNTSAFFQEKIELPFFNHFLKGKGENDLPEAYVFETGRNRWHKFEQWPPKGTAAKTLFLSAKNRLTADPPPPGAGTDADTFPSDPRRPVPYTDGISFGMSREYMTGDQRFASRRPDVLYYQTDVLEEDLTLAGPLRAELVVSTSATDADWVVKLIDVYPGNAGFNAGSSKNMGGYQMMVRSEVIRGRFRNSYEKPEPFRPGEPAKISLPLQDVLHTFKKGHRIMVQVCSTWFPLVDRNPQKFVPNIFQADDADFIPAMHAVYHSPERPSSLQFGVVAIAEKKE
jgi:putative CocE/NonD family hydrolase